MGLTVDRNDPAGRERRVMGQNKTSEARIWRAVDGTLVGENDPRAATLAYAVGTEVPAERVAEYDAFIAGADPAEVDPAGNPKDRAALRERVAPQGSGPATHATPISEKLATEVADEARMIANSDVDVRADEAEAADDGRVIARVRLARTEDGELVHEHDPRAAFLAYAEGDEIKDAAHKRAYKALANKVKDETPEAEGTEETDPSTVEGETPIPPDPATDPAKDATTPPATKAAKAPANKAAATPADK